MNKNKTIRIIILLALSLPMTLVILTSHPFLQWAGNSIFYSCYYIDNNPQSGIDACLRPLGVGFVSYVGLLVFSLVVWVNRKLLK